MIRHFALCACPDTRHETDSCRRRGHLSASDGRASTDLFSLYARVFATRPLARRVQSDPASKESPPKSSETPS